MLVGIVCFSDCLNVVAAFQSNDDFRTFWARDVLQRIRDMVPRFLRVQFLHAQRERNNTANCLA